MVQVYVGVGFIGHCIGRYISPTDWNGNGRRNALIFLPELVEGCLPRCRRHAVPSLPFDSCRNIPLTSGMPPLLASGMQETCSRLVCLFAFCFGTADRSQRCHRRRPTRSGAPGTAERPEKERQLEVLSKQRPGLPGFVFFEEMNPNSMRTNLSIEMTRWQAS